MSEHPELSRLPTDERYWERLEARIVESLPGSLAGPALETREWWAPLAEHAYPVGALALAAGLAAVLLLPEPPESSLAREGLLQSPAAGSAPIGLLAAEAPPSIDRLLFTGNRE